MIPLSLLHNPDYYSSTIPPSFVLLLTYSIHSSSLGAGKGLLEYFRGFFLFFLRVGGLAGLAGRLMAASCAFLWAFFFLFHPLNSFFWKDDLLVWVRRRVLRFKTH